MDSSVRVLNSIVPVVTRCRHIFSTIQSTTISCLPHAIDYAFHKSDWTSRIWEWHCPMWQQMSLTTPDPPHTCEGLGMRLPPNVLCSTSELCPQSNTLKSPCLTHVCKVSSDLHSDNALAVLGKLIIFVYLCSISTSFQVVLFEFLYHCSVNYHDIS